MPTFYEFFAGGGMARAGLGEPDWVCQFANDFDEMKAQCYRANWDADDLVVGDVASVHIDQVPGTADLAWASSPCQDLSLAGKSEGLGLPDDEVLTRSGTFWRFWALMRGLAHENRAPRIVVLENVIGAITSHKGKDFQGIATAFAELGYQFGAVVIDARLFVPQSRKRLFIIGVRHDLQIPAHLRAAKANPAWHPTALAKAAAQLPLNVLAGWVWWNLPLPPARTEKFIDLIEEEPTMVKWHTPTETQNLLDMMSTLNRNKVSEAMQAGQPMVGGVYRRMRPDASGKKVQRAEVRFDDISGCLRTPSGGSSRQTILLVEGQRVRSRLLSPREGARLMGLPETYQLPTRYNDAYHVTGDGVAVPVVRFLAANIFEPVLAHNPSVVPALEEAEVAQQ